MKKVLFILFAALMLYAAVPSVTSTDAIWSESACTGNLMSAPTDTLSGGAGDSAILINQYRTSAYQGLYLDVWFAPVSSAGSDSVKYTLFLKLYAADGTFLKTIGMADTVSDSLGHVYRIPLGLYPAPIFSLYVKTVTGHTHAKYVLGKAYLNVSANRLKTSGFGN
jgi:hypothetical protein